MSLVPRFRGAALAFAVLTLCPGRIWACTACFGQSDSPMAEGMNWGILSLLGIIGFVLAGVAAFFVFLAKRSATVAAVTAAAQPLPGTAAVCTSPTHRRSLAATQ